MQFKFSEAVANPNPFMGMIEMEVVISPIPFIIRFEAETVANPPSLRRHVRSGGGLGPHSVHS